MEDYDVFGEMQDVKNLKSVIIIEDDEEFVTKKILDSNFEIIPIRYGYDLSCFSNEYIEKTKMLFTYYYDENNNTENELLRIKKHFTHYQRKPIFAYIPNSEKYKKLRNILSRLEIKCIDNKNEFINIINSKLILIDIDDTLKHSDGTITQKTKDIVNNLIENNNIVICTARPRYYALKISKEINACKYIISSNGAEIYDVINDNIIYSSYLKEEDCKKIYDDAINKDLRVIFVSDNTEYVTKYTRNDSQILLNSKDVDKLLKNKIKQIMIIGTEKEKIKEYQYIIKENYGLNIIDESGFEKEEIWFSVANCDSSKGNALKILAQHLNIPIGNTIAIGNDKNDISMFEVAGLSVAVANASDDIKKMVDHVTLSNDEDGVAVFLETLT